MLTHCDKRYLLDGVAVEYDALDLLQALLFVVRLIQYAPTRAKGINLPQLPGSRHVRDTRVATRRK